MITDEQVNSFIAFVLTTQTPVSDVREDVRKALEAYEQSKWISLNDGLPENGVYVLWRCTELDMTEEREHFRITACFNNRPPKMGAVKFTHWQPLPEFKE